MSMHTELMTVNKRDWEEMVKLLRDKDEIIVKLVIKIQNMKDTIAAVIDQNL